MNSDAIQFFILTFYNLPVESQTYVYFLFGSKTGKFVILETMIVIAIIGIFWAPFPHWKILRSFVISSLREEGMGKASMEPQILEEVEHYIADFLEPNRGKPLDISLNISQATCNVMSQMVYGKRFEYKDVTTSGAISAINELIALSVKVAAIEHWPLASIFLKSSVEKERHLWQSVVKPTMDQYVNEHLANLDMENHKDLLDRFLIHSKNAQGEKTACFSSMCLPLHFFSKLKHKRND